MAEIFVKDVRLAFPALFEAEQFQGTGPFSYKATFLFPQTHPAYKLVNDAITAAAADKWKAKAPAILEALKAQNKLCLLDGKLKPDYDGFEGMFFLSASRKQEAGMPVVRLANNTPARASDGKPYAGCKVTGKVEVWAQDNKYGKRINCTLVGVQFIADGDSFSGVKPASDDGFDAVEEGADAADMM